MSQRNHPPTVKLPNSHWQCVVIGGGITGSGIVNELALRGISSALFEKNDFASGTSSKTGKLVHGGLRYLKHFHFKTVYESCRERFNLCQIIAPEIVKPVRFILPFYKNSKTPQWLAAIGLFIYFIISLSKSIGNFGRTNKEDLANLGPFFKKINFKGALSYYDCSCMDYRLVVTVLKSAFQLGATVVNYMEVYEVEKINNNKWKLSIKDRLTKEEFFVTADNVIYACGAWSEKVLAKTALKNEVKLKETMGVHILVPKDKLQLTHTIAIEHPEDYRPIYMVPWDKVILVGTTDHFCDQDLDHLKVTPIQLNYLLKAINHYFDGLSLGLEDIVSAYIGVRPLMGSDQGIKEEKISRDYKIVSTEDGLYAIIGGKLTTYRLMSESLVERVFADRYPKLQFVHGKSLKPLSRQAIVSEESFEAIIKNEWVEKLEDLIFRRTNLYLENGNNVINMLPDLIKIWGSTLGKNEIELARELKETKEKVIEEGQGFGTF